MTVSVEEYRVGEENRKCWNAGLQYKQGDQGKASCMKGT